MASVTKIPATVSRFTASPIAAQKKRRVAGYARISTDHDDQFTSYEAQIDYYTRYIKSRDDWEFVKVYTDEGKSGTGTKHREGFKSMVNDALNGCIDLIVTKSVSRFARNTVDSLTTIRRLKEKGVEVYFEKENIFTFDGKGELMLTIMSSLAQEESRSISENVTWGHRKRFSDGKAMVAFSHFLGYDRGKDGGLVVNAEQAKLVRRIYGLFLTGMSPAMIAKTLTSEGIPTPYGKEKWYKSTIESILKNEKYKGDALLQKTFTTDFLTKKVKKNEGELPQYYVRGSHEAIIDEDTFALVQTKLAARTGSKNRVSAVTIFCSRLKCGCCGGWYGPKVWHSNDKYRRVIWRCNHKFDGEKCTTPSLSEDEIKQVFLKAANIAITECDELISVFESYLAPKLSIEPLERDLEDAKKESHMIEGLIDTCINTNASVAQDQTAYNLQMKELEARLSIAEQKKKDIEKEIMRRMARRQEIAQHFDYLKQAGHLTEFRMEDWLAMLDYMVVHSKEEIWVIFKDGTRISTGI